MGVRVRGGLSRAFRLLGARAVPGGRLLSGGRGGWVGTSPPARHARVEAMTTLGGAGTGRTLPEGGDADGRDDDEAAPGATPKARPVHDRPLSDVRAPDGPRQRGALGPRAVPARDRRGPLRRQRRGLGDPP